MGGLVLPEEYAVMRQRGAWYFCALGLAVATVVSAHRGLEIVWPSLLQTFGDTAALAIVVTQVSRRLFRILNIPKGTHDVVLVEVVYFDEGTLPY